MTTTPITNAETNQEFSGKTLLQVIADLTTILETETHYLHTMQIDKLSELQPEKLRLVNVLEAAKRLAKLKPNYFSADLPKDRFIQASQAMEKAMVTNERELAKAVAVNKMVVQCLADAAKIYAQEQAGYSRAGKLQQVAANKQHAVPLTLNDSV